MKKLSNYMESARFDFPETAGATKAGLLRNSRAEKHLSRFDLRGCRRSEWVSSFRVVTPRRSGRVRLPGRLGAAGVHGDDKTNGLHGVITRKAACPVALAGSAMVGLRAPARRAP